MRRVTLWVLLFGLWIAFSGIFLLEFLVLGALSAAGGVVLSEIFFRGTHEGMYSTAPASVRWYAGTTLRFLAYLPWLTYEIVISNLHVVYLVLHPRMPIDPSLVEFRTTLTSEAAQVLLAQSITLTPGTVTIDASNGEFVVHCLSKTTRAGIASGAIQKKIAQVFGEPWTDHVELTDIERPEQVPL